MSGKVFAMRQAVEICLNLGMPTSQSIHGIYKLFSSPPLGGEGRVRGGYVTANEATPYPVSSPLRGEGIYLQMSHLVSSRFSAPSSEFPVTF